MADFKQAFAAEATITFAALPTLAANTGASSDVVDNSTTLYDEVILQLALTGTQGATVWLDVRILASTDDGTTWSTYTTPYLILPAVDFSLSPCVYHARFVPPKKWKVYVKNNSATNALTAGTTKFQGVYYTGS